MESTTVSKNRKIVYGIFIFFCLVIVILAFMFWAEFTQGHTLYMKTYGSKVLFITIVVLVFLTLFMYCVILIDRRQTAWEREFIQKGKRETIFQVMNENNQIAVWLVNIWGGKIKIEQLRFVNEKQEESCLISLMPSLRGKWQYFAGNLDGTSLDRGEKKVLLEYHSSSSDSVDEERSRILNSLNNISGVINLSVEQKRVMQLGGKVKIEFPAFKQGLTNSDSIRSEEK